MIFLFLLVVLVSKQIQFHVSHLCNFRDDEFTQGSNATTIQSLVRLFCRRIIIKLLFQRT